MTSTIDLRRGPQFATVLVVCLLGCGVPLGAQPAQEVKQVLLLQSTERGSSVFDRFTEILRSEVEARLGGPVTFLQVVVVPAGVEDPPDAAIVEYLRALYAGRSQPDLIVSVGGPAAAFARRHRDEIFPGSPAIYSAVEARYLGNAPLRANEAAVTVSLDYAGLVTEILELMPGTSNLFVLVASGPAGQFWRATLLRDFTRFGHLTVSFDNDLSYAEMLNRAAALPPHSAILMITSGTDARGGWHGGERTLTDVAARANAPLFGIHDVWLGLGIVGGRLLDNLALGGVAADAAVRILSGESPASVHVPVRTPDASRYDARQLRRWAIPERRLPSGSEVRYRMPSLWQDYRREVLTVLAALLLQSGLISGLLYQRRARRSAELQSRNNLALAADANRRLTMTALTGSIAHELSQPLNSILHNAQAGEMLVKSGRATPAELTEILSDIRASDVRASQIVERHRAMLKNRQVDMKPVDIAAIVRESLALVAHDTKSKQITIDVRESPQVCVVHGDHVLLQQVLVNLLMNAMDAMADAAPERRRITIDHELSPERITLLVSDAGVGLPARMDGALFEPFVTTKAHGMGIGLTIVQTIVEAHGGTTKARNNPAGGATFIVTLPRLQEAPA